MTEQNDTTETEAPRPRRDARGCGDRGCGAATRAAAPEEAAVEPAAPAEAVEALTPEGAPAARPRGQGREAALRVRRAAPEERQAERRRAAGARLSPRRTSVRRAREKARARRTADGRDARRASTRPGVQKTRQGVVVSDRADKTITVQDRHRPGATAATRRSCAPRARSHAHDERNDAHVGDTVIVRETRPLSRTKRWRGGGGRLRSASDTQATCARPARQRP